MIAFFYLLILLGSVQGLVTATILLAKKPQLLSHKLLAGVIVLIALPGIHLYGHYLNFFANTKFGNLLHAIIPWVMIMAVGPLLFFYTRTTLDKNFRIGGKQWLYFLPVLIDLFPKIMEIGFYAHFLPHWTSHNLVTFIDGYNRYADIPRWISLASYSYLSRRYVTNAAITNIAKITWVNKYLSAMRIFVIIWLLYLIPYLIPSINTILDDTVGWFPVYIPLAVLIYWMGMTAVQVPSKAEMIRIDTKKQDNSSYPLPILQQTSLLLIQSMDSDKLYLDPSLNLLQVAKMIHVAPKLVSATLNQLMNKNFNQFINEYRLEEFKRRALEPGAENITIPGLAASCGFSSPATFQRTFKQLTGQTPTEFLRLAHKKALSVP